MRKSLWAIFLDCADWLSRQTWIIWKLWNEMHGTNNLQQLVSHSFETTASLQTSLKLESKSTLWNDHGNKISRCLFFGCVNIHSENCVMFCLSANHNPLVFEVSFVKFLSRDLLPRLNRVLKVNFSLSTRVE